MSRLLELYGISTFAEGTPWSDIVDNEQCPFIGRKCLKVRKSQPDITIGTCSVIYGTNRLPVLICPHRLLERNQIFADCWKLLTLYEPGDQLHIISEVTIPGGSVDYFLVSAQEGKVTDFVGIELQTLDTTGTVWPKRQEFLLEQGVDIGTHPTDLEKSFGMNWKMTAKTILMQLHHKIHTFESINKHLVLVIQNPLLAYMQSNFRLDHLSQPTRLGDSFHIHAYSIQRNDNYHFRLKLDARLSTDANGIATSLGMQADPKLDLEEITKMLESKINDETIFTFST